MICCCCSCSLRTATLIIGGIFTIISVVYCVLLPITIENAILRRGKYQKEIDNDTKILIAGLVGFAVLLITSILLLVGAAMRKRRLLFPWIITFSLGLVAWVIDSVVNMSQENQLHTGGIGQFLSLAIFFAIIALNVYFVKIVIDYTKELKVNEVDQGNEPKDIMGAEDSLALSPSSKTIPIPPEKGEP